MSAEHGLKRTRLVVWLASALFLAACSEDVPLNDRDDEEQDDDKASADDSDDADDAPSDDEDDEDDAPPTNKDAGSKVDAGTKPPSALDAGTKPTPQGTKDGSAETTTDAGSGGGGIMPRGDGGGASSPDSAVPGERMDLGKGDGKDVIAIGDSWMSLLGTGIQQSLVKASGQPYRTYGVPATKLLDEVIPRQYASAKRADPDIKTVVMTGGGNDILLGGGLEGAMSVIDKVGVRLDALWTEMGKDGVQDVIYIEYSEGGSNGPNVRYGIEKVGPICKNHKALRCHFMLSDPIIMMTLRDGIHPTDAGYDKLGKAAFDLMVAEGMRR
jgi:hypothetical protein